VVPAAFVVAFALIALRRPDALAYAQFYAEDGDWWYAQAHELGGFHALLLPYRDYLTVAPRLVAWASLGVPLRYAPLAMNVAAIAIQALVSAFLCSSRFAAAVPPLWARVALAVAYVALPNIGETIGTVTNAQWHLAVLASAVALAAPSLRIAWRAFDVAAVALSALSGPFVVFLLPIIAIKWFLRGERWLLVLAAVALAGAVAQLWVVATSAAAAGERPPLAASLDTLSRVVTGRIVYPFFIGQAGYEQLFADPKSGWLQPLAFAVFALAFAALMGYALLRAPLELRLFVLFALLVLAGAMAFPSREPRALPLWWTLTGPGTSNRYFLMPTFAIVLVLTWLAARRVTRFAALAVLAVACVFAVARDFRIKPPLDYDFAQFVAKYERAAPGTKVQILYPPGWSMVLTKR
jgi:hypothetical protein